MAAIEEEKKEPVQWGRGFAALWELVGSEKRNILILAGFALVSAVGNGAVPYVTGRFFDALTSIANSGTIPSEVFLVFGIWVLVQIVTNSIDWYSSYRYRYIDTRIQMKAQMDGFLRLLRLPMEFHKRERMGELTEIISRAGWMCSSTVRSLSDIVPQLLSVLVGIAFAFSINIMLALVLVAGAVVYSVMLWFVVRNSAETYRVAHTKWAENWGNVSAAAEHVDTVKAFATEQYEEEKTRRSWLGDTFNIWMKIEKVWSYTNFYQRIIVFAVQGTVLGSSIWLVSQGAITIGELVAFNGYAMMFLGPFVSFGYAWQTIQNGLVAAVRFHERIWSQPLEQYEPANAIALPTPLQGAVSFNNVTFSYSDGTVPVLRDVSFSVQSGEVVALVGESGGGKSTLIGLLLAFYFPTSGTVTVDGVDSRKLRLAEYRSQIAEVPQEVALFNDTIGMNIKYGSFDATDEQVQQAVQIAQAEDFIEQLPQKYETLVGERGVKLSVGQKQRVAVARAVLRDPRILILDEPTSALDAKTEHSMTQALEKLMRGRTTFIIAHRLSTVRKADKIIVLKDGKIAEMGSHGELIKNKAGIYHELYEHQIGLRE